MLSDISRRNALPRAFEPRFTPGHRVVRGAKDDQAKLIDQLVGEVLARVADLPLHVPDVAPRGPSEDPVAALFRNGALQGLFTGS